MSDGTRRFIAGAVVAVGAIIVLLAGPCTAFFGGGALVELFRGGDASLAGFILALSLIFGGLPTVAGIVLIINGWRSLRRPPQ